MRTAPVLCLLALALSSCLDSDEELTVRPDGSIAVQISAKAKAADLSDGYPVPLDGKWTAENDATREWIRVLGPDTGSASVRANLEALGNRDALLPADKEFELRVSGEFPTVGDLPRFLAPESEVFRTAYLERGNELRVEKKSGRTVYTFERTYRGRMYEHFDAGSRFKEMLPKEIFAKLEKEESLSDAERATISGVVVDSMRRAAGNTANEALATIYTQGDAALPLATSAKILESVAGAVERVVTRERVDRILRGVFPPAGQPKDPEAEKAIASLEKELRETLRTSFDSALQAARTPTPARNALRGGLEWLFTAHDHTDDLGDDNFHLVVHMPGTIVSGNYDELDRVDRKTASWKFAGDTLRDRDRVLRVVSVVE